jgi:Lipocalin-like domain
MNRQVMSVCAITALGLAALPAPSVAQQKSSKEMLVGAWTLLLADGVKGDGTHVPQFGPNPDGVLMFSPTGRYSVQFERANLPKIKANDREKATADESKAIAGGTLAHFGTYTVNDADKTLTMHIEASSFPNWDGTKQVRKITALTDDVLTYSVANPSAAGAAGDIAQLELVWRKVK